MFALLRALGLQRRGGAAARAFAASSSSSSTSFSPSTPSAAPAAVSSAAVKALREATGAGFLDCQRALQAERGDVARAVDFLRKKGLAAAAKKAARTAAQGLVAVALGEGGAAGAMVELNSETDFVARNAHFQALAARLARTALASGGAAGAAGEGRTPDERFASSAAAAAALAQAELAPAAAGAGGAAVAVAAASSSSTAAAAATSVGESVAELVGKVGENIVLRRVAALSAGPGGLVCAYVHSAAAPGLGSIGVLVALAPAAAPAAPGGGAAKAGAAGAAAAGTAAAAAAAAPPPSAAALQELGKRVAMHIAAARPPFLGVEDVPAAEVERERGVLLAHAQASGKEGKHVESMIRGRLQKFFAEACLLEQAFVLDEKQRVGALVRAAGARVVAFRVFAVGEGVAAAGAAAAAPAPAAA